MKSYFSTCIIVLVCFTFYGCFTRIHEHHFFRDHLEHLPNYYKIKVRGSTFLFSKTRYYSGYFKSDAIDTYFNEFTQPKNGRIVADSLKVNSINEENVDKQLVLIMSSNADAIAEQIGNITQSKNTLSNLISLTTGEKQQHLTDLQTDSSIQIAKNELFIAIGDGILNDLESKDTTQVKYRLLQFMNQIAAENGNSKPFITWNDAQDWLANYRNSSVKSY
ncbi:hypothetical protein [Larkinella sp. C7]|uniref:hypothetical protein n=1 Tax=Larkinella sp. C7 TaxID=2576607 RepID=UPI0011111CC6|nr:hypothetical protein [Larkinella sp. C7]